MRKTVISLLAIFGTIGIYAQELHTHSNAASINNEANSFTGWAGNATESSTSSESYSGSYSLKLEAPSNGWYYSSYTFPTTANEEYLITFYAKSASNEDPRVYWSGGTENTAILITNSNWTQYSHTIIATGSSININAYSGTPAVTGNAIYIDHVSITLVGADTQAPTAPTNFSSTAQTDTTIDLSWNASTDNVGVTEYKVYRDNALIATLGNVNTYQMTGLTAATTYSFAVRALDAAGNQSLASNLSVTTDASSGGSDTQAPTSPALSSSVITDTTADFSWSGATDNTAVTNYNLYKDGVLEAPLGNVSTYQVTGLTASTAYNFTVTALDAAGNESTVSNSVPVTTNASSGGGSSIWSEANSVANYTGDVAIGTSTVPSGYKLAVHGKIIGEELKVQLQAQWPDYVFAENYNLPSLEDVQKHIKENGRLINIPSAKEVEANGLEVGEMNRLLLEKIEELTLHAIKQQKEIYNLQKEMAILKN